MRQAEELMAELAIAAPKAAVFDNVMSEMDLTLARIARSLPGLNSMQIKSDLMGLGYLYVSNHGKGTYRVSAQHRGKLFEEKVIEYGIRS